MSDNAPAPSAQPPVETEDKLPDHCRNIGDIAGSVGTFAKESKRLIEIIQGELLSYKLEDFTPSTETHVRLTLFNILKEARRIEKWGLDYSPAQLALLRKTIQACAWIESGRLADGQRLSEISLEECQSIFSEWQAKMKALYTIVLPEDIPPFVADATKREHCIWVSQLQSIGLTISAIAQRAGKSRDWVACRTVVPSDEPIEAESSSARPVEAEEEDSVSNLSDVESRGVPNWNAPPQESTQHQQSLAQITAPLRGPSYRSFSKSGRLPIERAVMLEISLAGFTKANAAEITGKSLTWVAQRWPSDDTIAKEIATRQSQAPLDELTLPPPDDWPQQTPDEETYPLLGDEPTIAGTKPSMARLSTKRSLAMQATSALADAARLIQSSIRTIQGLDPLTPSLSEVKELSSLSQKLDVLRNSLQRILSNIR